MSHSERETNSSASGRATGYNNLPYHNYTHACDAPWLPQGGPNLSTSPRLEDGQGYRGTMLFALLVGQSGCGKMDGTGGGTNMSRIDCARAKRAFSDFLRGPSHRLPHDMFDFSADLAGQ